MRKHLWKAVVAAGVLLLIAAALAAPKAADILHKAEAYDQLGLGQEYQPDYPPSDQWYIIEPGNWWKGHLDQQQIEILRGLWGKQMTIGQLLQQVWPAVLDQIPPEFATLINSPDEFLFWPMEQGITLTMDETMAKGRCVQDGGRTIEGSTPASLVQAKTSLYLIAGRETSPQKMFYRVSIYVEL